MREDDLALRAAAFRFADASDKAAKGGMAEYRRALRSLREAAKSYGRGVVRARGRQGAKEGHVPMTEEAMDKAVEEALTAFVGKRPGRSPREQAWPEESAAMDLLWQRAQEAEREAQAKAMCNRCRAGHRLVHDPTKPPYWEHPPTDTWGWTMCSAEVIHGSAWIRNRSAARESVVERTEGR